MTKEECIKKVAAFYHLSYESAAKFYEVLKDKLPPDIFAALWEDKQKDFRFKDLTLKEIIEEHEVPYFEALIQLGTCMISEEAYEAYVKEFQLAKSNKGQKVSG